MRRGFDDDVRGPEEAERVIYQWAQRWLPAWLRRWLLHFDTTADESVRAFASSLAANARVLDAGAGESRHRSAFAGRWYVALDLAVGDVAWNYSGLDVLGDLTRLPFADGVFDGALNVVTLEHVQEPQAVVKELARVVRPGALLLFVVPHEWEVHQSPHDYFRYTRHGLQLLLERAGLRVESLEPVGGYFRLMSRRLLNGLQFFPGPLFFVAALILVPLALLAPIFEGLDRRKDFTLGYVARAVKP